MSSPLSWRFRSASLSAWPLVLVSGSGAAVGAVIASLVVVVDVAVVVAAFIVATAAVAAVFGPVVIAGVGVRVGFGGPQLGCRCGSGLGVLLFSPGVSVLVGFGRLGICCWFGDFFFLRLIRLIRLL